MAIYRKGQVSLDAQGYLTGYNTKWKASLTLIRPGATIIIASNPVIYGVVSEVISDTSIRLINFGKATAAKSDYVILLHDSLTVDGLAQDVAETLRYYQGKETEFAHFIEVIKGLDYEKLEALIQRIKHESEEFEKNLAEIDKRVEQTKTYANQAQQSAHDAAARKDEVSILHTQTEDLKNQAAQQVTAAAQQVALAKEEVRLAKAEVQKAEGEAVKANKEFIKAKAEATLAQEIVAGAKLEVVNEARAEVERARSEADRAQGVVDNAKQEIREEVQVQVDSATEQADRAKREADRAQDLADSFDADRVMLKSKNLSDVDDLEVARTNIKVDRLVQDANMTRVKASDGKAELRIGFDDWYVYRDSHDSEAGYIALPVKGGGTGGTTPLEAREGLELERFRQHTQRTEMATANGEYRLFVGDEGDWGVLNKQSEHVVLPVRAGGTGAKDAATARKNLGLDRVVQDSNMTRIKSQDSKTELRIGQSDWYVFRDSQDSERGYIALPVQGGGTGANDAAGARANLGLGGSSTVKFGTIQIDAPAANPLLLKSANPCIRLEETDAPAGRAKAFVLVMDGGNIRMQENDTGTGDEVYSYDSSNNTMKLPKAEFRDKAGTRNNLELGTANTVTFSQVRAPNGMICTTESNSTNDNPSAPLVMQIRASDKSTILGQAEFRADRNGALSIINRTVPNSPKFFTIQSTGEVNPPGEIVSNSGGTFSYMEVGRKNANSATYVDFHYGAKYDYDARIICDGMNSDQAGGGNLRFYSGYENHLAKGSYNFQGGRFRVTTSDMVIECPVNISRDLTINSTRWNHDSSDTVPQKGSGGSRGIHTGVDSYDFNKASNINLYSWYSIGFCTTYGSPTNGVVAGKPAVLINTRNGDINTKGAVISKGVTLTCDRTQKSDIREIDDEYVLDRMCKVSNYTYRYNEGISYTCGIMAQELEIWMPELVSKNESDNDSLNVNHAGLVGYLHSCIRALKARNDELEGRLRKIESYLAFKFPEDDI